MARKRLNKKVVIIGTIVLALILVAGIGLLLRLTQDPEEFIREGDAARTAQDYESAVRNYQKAFTYARRNTPERIKIAFKLAELYLEYNEWPKAMECWNRIINFDTENVKARMAILNYFYEFADSGMWTAWRQAETHASELIDIEPTAYLYFVRGRARLEMAMRGETADREAEIAQAREDLENVRRLEPDNVEAYRLLAQAMLTEGEILVSRGAFDEKEKSLERACEILTQAVDVAPDDPDAHINLLLGKLIAVQDVNQVRDLEPEFLTLTDKFAATPDVFATLSAFYQQFYLRNRDRANIDKAIEAIERANELDKDNVAHLTTAAKLYYQKACYPKNPSYISKAIQMAEHALTLDVMQDVPGPRQVEGRKYRFDLNCFLANCYIEQALEAEADREEQKQLWLDKAEGAVGQIQQILPSGEHPYSVMWDGMLELARGDRRAAVKKMYSSYERIKVSDTREVVNVQFARLSHALAEALQNSPEIGARVQFLSSAFYNGIIQTKPDAILDYAEILLRLNQPAEALYTVDFFQEKFSPNNRSELLRFQVLIAAGKFGDAEQELARMDPAEPDTIRKYLLLAQAKIQHSAQAVAEVEEARGALVTEQERAEPSSSYESLKAELEGYKNTRAELLDKLLIIEATEAELPVLFAVCKEYLDQSKVQQAQNLIDRFLVHLPDNVVALIYKQQLLEPEPANITPERMKQIRQKVLLAISDPLERAMQWAWFYQQNNQFDQAVEQCREALRIEPADLTASNLLFDVALQKKDFDLAQEVVDAAVVDNLDTYQGQLLAARLAIVKEQYDEALLKLDDCLKQSPIFSFAYVLRSMANSALGNEPAAIEDAKKAVSLNPLNSHHAKRLFSALYQRDRRLGAGASPEQLDETKNALLRARALDPADPQLLSLYAEYISDTEPMMALAYRQRLQKYAPSVENAVLLGNLAAKLALTEANTKRKAALLQVASSAFEQAFKIDPQNKLALSSRADFYRQTGQLEKADQLLTQSEDKDLAWRYYARGGQFDKARQILGELYQADSHNVEAIRGLLHVAQKTRDKEAMPQYAEKLLALEDTPRNRLYEIQVLIDSDLTEQAEKKLAGFREKYPDQARQGLVMQLEANLRTKKGQFDEALNLLNRTLESSQDNAGAWHLRGKLNYSKGNYAQAISDLQRSKVINPTTDVRLDLAKAYLRAGRPDNTINELVAVMESDQEPAEARVLLEQAYSQLGKKELLVKLYEEALKKYPDDVFWHDRYAKYLFNSRNVEAASQLWYEGWQNSQKAGGDSALFDVYLMSLQAQRKHDELLAYASKYVDTEFAAIAYSRMADAKAVRGNRVATIQYYQKAIEKAEGDNNLTLEMLRRMHATVGKEETARWCERRLQTEPDSLVANLAMYHIMFMNGQYNKALLYIDKCLEIIGPDPDKAEQRANLVTNKTTTLETAYLRTSDERYLDAAIAEYESILEKYPNRAKVLNNLAYMLAVKGRDLEKAARCAQLACKLRPDKPDYFDTHALVLYSLGEYERAVEVERSAIQLYELGDGATAPAGAYDNLGKISEKLEQYTEALAAYKQALKIGQRQLSEVDKKRISEAVERISEGAPASAY